MGKHKTSNTEAQFYAKTDSFKKFIHPFVKLGLFLVTLMREKGEEGTILLFGDHCFSLLFNSSFLLRLHCCTDRQSGFLHLYKEGAMTTAE